MDTDSHGNLEKDEQGGSSKWIWRNSENIEYYSGFKLEKNREPNTQMKDAPQRLNNKQVIKQLMLHSQLQLVVMLKL